MSWSSLRFISSSCAAEYSAARVPWRQDLSGGTTNPIDWGGSDRTTAFEIVFSHQARISSMAGIPFFQSENAHYDASCDSPKWVEIPIYVQCQHRSITPRPAWLRSQREDVESIENAAYSQRNMCDIGRISKWKLRR